MTRVDMKCDTCLGCQAQEKGSTYPCVNYRPGYEVRVYEQERIPDVRDNEIHIQQST